MGRLCSMVRFDLEAGKPDTPQEPINRERNYEPSSVPNSQRFESIASSFFDRTLQRPEASHSRAGGDDQAGAFGPGINPMSSYYNEIDPYAAQWLRNLIEAGHIASGEVDERSIKDVKADDLKGYE